MMRSNPSKYSDRSPHGSLSPRRSHGLVIACFCALVICGGCRTFSGASLGWPSPFGDGDAEPSSLVDDPSAPTVVQAGSDFSPWEQVTQQSNRVVNFIQGKEQEDEDNAQKLYKQADVEFAKASQLPRENSADAFRDAATLFRRAGEASPGTALEQDALFMQGESLFFSDRLTEATDVYQRLQKEFPRNKYNDQVAARLFSISRYWIDVDKATQDDWFKLSFLDSKRPTLDVNGHAIRVLDQIRYDDPTGRLADDATMAAAAEYLRNEKYEDADEFLTDLRESFPDSEHLFLAHLLGIHCKMKIYGAAGPQYSALMLDEADKLIQQTRTRFPDKLSDPKHAEMLAKASAEVAYRQAEKLYVRAQLRDKQHYYGAAAKYYQRILDKFADTPFADQARERLQAIGDQPAKPAKRLSWLQNIFPSKRGNKPPLETTYSQEDTMLR